MAKAFDYIQVPLSVVATDLTGASIEAEGAYFRLVRLIAVGGPMKLADIRRRIGEVSDVEHALNWRSSDAEPLLSFSWMEEWRERANSARERMSAAGRVSAEKRAKKKRKLNTRSTSVEQTLNSSSTNVEHATILSSTISIGRSEEERASVVEAQLWPTFTDWWTVYAKGSKKLSAELWEKIPQKEREAIMAHTPKYIASKPDMKYRKDGERYLKHRTWEDPIIEETSDRNGHNTIQQAHDEIDRLVAQRYGG